MSFRGGPTPATRARLIEVCEAFKAYLPSQASVAGVVPLSDQMLTYWPLDDPAALEARAEECGYAVDHYDLVGGLKAIEDARRQHALLTGEGPFLLGWSPSSSRGVPDRLVLVVDMSAFHSQDSFNRAFQFWQEKVVENPAMWRHGFNSEAIRLAFRDFCDQYGSDLMNALHFNK